MRRVIASPAGRVNSCEKLAAKALFAVAATVTADQITSRHVREAFALIRDGGYAQTTRRLAATYLKRLLNQLVADGVHPSLPAQVPNLPSPHPRAVTVTVAQLDNLIAAAPPWLRLVILLCHDCALRSGTARKLTWSHVVENTICVPTKRGAVARVPVSGRLQALLEHCPKGDGPLVQLMFGKRMPETTLSLYWRQLLAVTGCPKGLRLHDLRRTMAEKAYEVTGDLRLVQLLLGHGALGSTLHYLQRPAARLTAQLAAAVHEVTK